MKRFGLVLAVAAGFAVVAMPASEALAVCCGANCCCIDGNIQSSGDTNPANPCEICSPSASTTDWTPRSDCGSDAGTTTPPDDDGGCSAAGGPAGAYGFALVGAALAFFRRRRR